MSRVLFAGGGTGGHLYPAIALAEALQRDHVGIDVHFVGAQRGVEARVLPNEGKPHTLLPFQPLRRSQVWQNWQLVPAMVRSANGLRRLFKEFKPELVVGTGGYASAPACMWALLHKIPVAVQEQNSHPGLTTRTLSRWARQVHLGFPEARRYIKPGKLTEVTALGNPIRPPDPTIDRPAARAAFGLKNDTVVVLVVGGSQGSRAINEALLGAIALAPQHPDAPAPRLEILWATGPTHIESINARLPENAKAWVKTVGYITNMSAALVAASVAISRAGAMGTAELLAWGVPMVLIPLPTAAADHQTYNARALAEAGAAHMLVERELTGERLWHELKLLITDEALRNKMRAAALDRARPQAAEDIAQRLAALLERA
ncbi:MAG TPA: undecaprenyldiphospho-muramoylpentapeptide beta-N-acetylglucosaminyltransferase [Longimicrobiales bacterium]|nr:undecaprenyldiphospho-muramoylpentapeptide beta-N-acetylglucosaminyltransferase [Longimicrobiales bacterium]